MDIHARMKELDEQFNFETMKGKPLYKKKGQAILGSKLDTSVLVVVTDTKDGRVFFQKLDGQDKKTSSHTTFRQQYELVGFVD